MSCFKIILFTVVAFLLLSSCSNANPISTFIDQHAENIVKQVTTDEFALLFALPDHIKVGEVTI